MNDIFNLQRFVEAQAPVIERVKAELEAGYKTSHWMWYIFPQIAGLGLSPMSARYAISGCAEAAAYLAHSVLGPRLIECTSIVNRLESVSALEIFGAVDAQKFYSSMTLFAAAAEPQVSNFALALDKYFGGERDRNTITRLKDGIES